MADKHERLQDDVAAYAVGLIEPIERTWTDTHLRRCEACAGRFREYRAVLGLLPHALPSETPPAGALATLLREARRRRAGSGASVGRGRAKVAWWPWPEHVRSRGWVTAAVFAGLLGWNHRDRDSDRSASRHRQDPHSNGARAAPSNLRDEGMVPVTRPEMVHEPFGEWSALAAVGALDGAERARFDAHLASGCATCEASLREFSQVAAALPWALPDVPLRPEVRDRLMDRVTAQRLERADRDASARPNPTATNPAAWTSAGERRPWRWAGGLVAAGLATALVWGLHDTREALESEHARAARLEQELAQERAVTSLVGHTDTHVAALRGLDTAARADGWIVWSPSKREGFMVVHNLPMLPAGRHYQLWVLGESTWAPAGAFQVDAIGHAVLTVPVKREHPERFAVTVEPAGPQSAPTGPTVMQGGESR